MPRIFISYIREDRENVDALCTALQRHGVEYWRDVNDLCPGENWKDAIRRAIHEGHYFIACFSEAYHARDRTHMNEELTLAIDELRQRHLDRPWFIPVLFSGEVPNRSISAGQSLSDLQCVDFRYLSWDAGVERIIDVIHGSSSYIASLSARLEDTKTNVKIEAARELGTFRGNQTALDALGRALFDRDESVVQEAVAALCKAGDEGTSRLVSAASDPRLKDTSRLAIIGVLGEMRGAARVGAPFLINMLDQNNMVAFLAVEALGKIGEPEDLIVPALRRCLRMPGLAAYAARALAHFDDSEKRIYVRAKDLARKLDWAKNDREHQSLVADLQHIGELAVAPLVEVGGDNCRRALVAMGRNITPQLLSGLCEVGDNCGGVIVKEEDITPQVMSGRCSEACNPKMLYVPYIIEVLGALGDPRAVPPLIDLLVDSYYSYTSYPAAVALGQIGDPRCVPALEKLAREGGATASAAAIEALGKVGAEGSIPVIIDYLIAHGSDDRFVSNSVERALVGIMRRLLAKGQTPPSIDEIVCPALLAFLPETGYEGKKDIEDVFRTLGNRAFMPLARTLVHKDGDLRLAALTLLKSIVEDAESSNSVNLAGALEHLPDAEQIARTALLTPPKHMRYDAQWSWNAPDLLRVMHLFGRAAVPLLLEKIEEPAWAESVVLALGRIADPDSVPSVFDHAVLLRWKDPAINAIVAVGPLALPFLVRKLRGGRPDVRDVALSAVCKILGCNDPGSSTFDETCKAVGVKLSQMDNKDLQQAGFELLAIKPDVL